MFTKRHYEFLAKVAAKAVLAGDSWDVEWYLRNAFETSQANFNSIAFRMRVAKLVEEGEKEHLVVAVE